MQPNADSSASSITRKQCALEGEKKRNAVQWVKTIATLVYLLRKHAEWLSSLRARDECIMLSMTMSVPCSDADDSTASPAQTAQPQTGTSYGFLATTARLGPNRAHLAHGFGVASLVAHDVACGEAECTDEDDNAGADNPGEQCGADLFDQGALLARLLPVSAATPCVGDSGAGLAL